MQPNNKGSAGTDALLSGSPDLELLQVTQTTPAADTVSDWVDSTINDAVHAASFAPTSTNPLNGVPALQGHHARPKGKAAAKKLPPAAQRKWLMMDDTGATSMASLSKTMLTQDLGIQLRDLR